MVCVETRHMQAVLRARINKTGPQRCARHGADDAGGDLPPEQLVILHRRLLAIVRDDVVCRRLMTTPGVGPEGPKRQRGIMRLGLPKAGIDPRQEKPGPR